jgi:hypothetical protein
MKWKGFLVPVPVGDRDYCIGPNFWKFYLIKNQFHIRWTGFFGESVQTVWIGMDCFGVQSVDTDYENPANVFVTPCFGMHWDNRISKEYF